MKKLIICLLDLYQKEKEKNSYIKDNYISKDKFKEFENEIYNSFDYDMGISQQFIDFLETNNIINRKVK